MDILRTFALHLPTHIEFGMGVVQQLGSRVNQLDGSNVLFVTDHGVLRAGLLRDLQNSLEQKGIAYAVFDEVEPNPKEETVMRGVRFAKERGSDILVAVGGGSVIDTAKAMGILQTQGGKLADYAGWNKINAPSMPVIAIPTTAGTGSEVTFWTVITDGENETKFSIGSSLIAPRFALVDPVMTRTLPAPLTSSTGMDALTHAVEAYTSAKANPVTDALALDAIRLIAQNIRKATFQGNDMEARSRMMLASLMAGIAFDNADLGAVHCMSEAVGGMYNSPHGATNAYLLPFVMEYNALVCEEKMAKIADAMGVNISGKSRRASARSAVQAVKELCADLRMPTLKAFGVQKDRLPELARRAAENVSVEGNPREMDEDDFLFLFRKALDTQNLNDEVLT